MAVKNLSVNFAQEEVLKKIDFQVFSGEILAVVGANGSGKTTLFKGILGLLPIGGTVEMEGDVGFVPQKFFFDRSFPLTVEEFLKLSQKINDQKKRIWALNEVGILKFLNKKIGELSGGQLQRLLIARALLNNPKILFFDEPTAGIDLEGEEDFYKIIEHQNKVHGVTILMISHDVVRVQKIAHRLLCLRNGEICESKEHCH